MLLIEEGVDVAAIDNAMMDFGYPVGPVKLVDEVGIDVGFHVGKVMETSMASRHIKPSTVIQRLYENGFKGRKNNRGFYKYNGKTGKKTVNPEVQKTLKIKRSKKIDIKEIQQRVCLAMVNEAIICLEKGIIKSPEDGDVGAILGLGFPPFRGGPFNYVDQTGPDKIFKTMKAFHEKFGPRFTPADLLADLAIKGKKFY
jgi:3-hydroxyacyl-CoA dehydrogenase/enoyl-CoA hydratase/3-hydroxybutyryl-CoA epimerase